jgi:RNA polymerase sigma-70 factor, ECF subfamily
MGITPAMDLSDPTTFARAYDEHGPAVYGTALRVLGNPAAAQDVAQDVFLRVWRRPRAFDPARGDLGAYLRLMGRSRALDVWREGQVRTRATDRFKLTVGKDESRVDDQPDTIADRHQESDEVREALEKLPAAQREALVLAYWGGLTADQIAQRVHIPLGTAKSRIRLGLARLRDEYVVPV